LCSVHAGCTHFYLRVLPGSPGLLIHAHGVFLPFEPIRRNSWSRNAGGEKKVTRCMLVHRQYWLGNDPAFVLFEAALSRDGGELSFPQNGLLWRLQGLGC